MPIFRTFEEAQDFILSQVQRGLICEQRFGLEGIEVVCRLDVGEVPTFNQRQERVVPIRVPGQGSLFNEPEPEPETRRQEIFPQDVRLELPHELRDYQAQAVRFAMAHRHCIIEIPTGRGKSLISLAVVNEIIRERPMRVLVLVPTTVLLDQWINDGFKTAGVEASAVGGGQRRWGQYTVSTYQSAIRNLDQVGQFNIVVFDEVHHLFSPEYSKILLTLLNAPDAETKYLVGLTATVREYGEGKAMQNRYFPDVFSKSIEEFQSGAGKIPVQIERRPVQFDEYESDRYETDRAIIRKANRAMGPIPEWPKYTNSSDPALRNLARGAISAYARIKRLLTETPEKLNEVISILNNNSGQFIIFSDTIDGITAIEKALQEHNISEGSIFSGVRAGERQRILAGLRDGSIRVLVGGNAISEGLDLPDISNVILTSMLVRSTRTPVQRLGRVLRPRPGKQVKIFLVFVKDTLEEENAMRVYDILGESM
jgi:superfamily II DNA or RNA helicase